MMRATMILASLLLAQVALPTAASAVSATQEDKVTPVEKVITLLEDLSKEIEMSSKKEAKSYNQFACFCKDMTMKKSDSIKETEDSIKSLSAEIGAKTAEKEDSIAEKAEREAKKEQAAKELADTKALFAKEQATYDQTSAELTKAIMQLERAIKALEDSRPTALLLQSVQRDIKENLELAQALDLVNNKQSKTISTFLQVDPKDPAYKFHSQPIIDVLNELLQDYRAHKGEVDAEWKKTEDTYTGMIKELGAEVKDQEKAISGLEQKIERLAGEIAAAREKLLTAEFNLKEDQLYMKDLTKTCEDSANDWDQRTQCHAEELEAQAQALKILKGTVSTTDEEVNKRALLGLKIKVAPAADERLATDGEPTSFLQMESPRARVRSLIERSRSSLSLTDAAKGEALQLIASEARRLQSPMLLALAARAAKDPFTKIKKIIQQLIERLLREANEEATKKGFCDTELGKAEQDRDYRMEDVLKLNNELEVLEVKLKELTESADLLNGKMGDLSEALGTATKLRADGKAENLEDIATAKEGLAAVNQAILILKNYYTQAAKGTVLQQQSPVDEDTQGPGFEGKCHGSQEKSQAIIGLLEVIRSDYERTIRNTEASEKKAAADFVEYDRATKADYAGKNMTQTLETQDAETTKSTIEKKMKDLQTNQDLLDAALKELEELKPTCIDTGMSYEERVAKREEEMAALKKALCILDTDKVEPDCQ